MTRLTLPVHAMSLLRFQNVGFTDMANARRHCIVPPPRHAGGGEVNGLEME
jgi:hypothetical protein